MVLLTIGSVEATVGRHAFIVTFVVMATSSFFIFDFFFEAFVDFFLSCSFWCGEAQHRTRGWATRESCVRDPGEPEERLGFCCVELLYWWCVSVCADRGLFQWLWR